MRQTAEIAALREECNGLRKENAELKEEIKLLQKEIYDFKIQSRFFTAVADLVKKEG